MFHAVDSAGRPTLCCCRCRLDWPVRTLSFSHDGRMLASASEDHFIDIAEVETGQWIPVHLV